MINKDNMIFTNREMNEQSVIVEQTFNQWLEFSNLDYKQFMSYRTIPDYKIEMKLNEGYCYTRIGYYDEGHFVQIGENFIFEEKNQESYIDLYLLLVYIANKYDNENDKAPAFEKRQGYFLNITKKFISKNMKEIYSR